MATDPVAEVPAGERVGNAMNDGRERMGEGKIGIVVLVKGLGIGGAERLIASGAAHWDTERFDYHVAYVLPWKDALVAEIEALGLNVTCIGGPRGFDAAVPRRWRRLLREVKPDLVHAHLPSTGILARIFGGVPVVYTEHNMADSYRLPTRLLNRLTYGRNRAVAAVSDAVRGTLVSFPGPAVQVIENGVATRVDASEAQAARSELGMDDSDPLVVHVGNIRPHKGHENLVEAASILFSRHPTVRIVSIGGEKHPGDLDRVRALAKSAGVDERLTFTGSRPDALSFIAASNLFVNPADVEGLPVAILEALSLGKPVVATEVGGVPSVVIDDKTGILAPPKDPAALAQAVLEILNDPEKAERMGSQGRQVVESRFGLAVMVERYERIYQEVLELEKR